MMLVLSGVPLAPETTASGGVGGGDTVAVKVGCGMLWWRPRPKLLRGAKVKLERVRHGGELSCVAEQVRRVAILVIVKRVDAKRHAGTDSSRSPEGQQP